MNLLIALALVPVALGAETGIVGTVVDRAGQPIAGARVGVATAAPRVGRGLFCPSCYLDCQKSARTDAKGTFLIADVDPALKFRLVVSAVGHKSQLTPLVDPLEGPTTVRLDELPRDVPPERLVRGKVVDDAGVAVEGALIDPVGARTANRRLGGRVDVDPTITDGKGAFSLILPTDYQGIDIAVSVDGYAGTVVNLLRPGQEPKRIEIPFGARVTGRLVRHGMPVPDARVAVVQLDRSAGRHFIQAVGATSDADGRFVMENLPAAQDYAIFSVVGEGPQMLVLTTKKFRMPGNRKSRDLGDLELITPLRLAGQIECGPGVPPGTTILLGREPAWDLISIPVREDGRFEVDGLPPETYVVHVAAEGMKLSDALPYQTLDDQSFGLRLERSQQNLRIPIEWKSGAK